MKFVKLQRVLANQSGVANDPDITNYYLASYLNSNFLSYFRNHLSEFSRN